MFLITQVPVVLEHPDIDKYSHVALLSIDSEDCIVAGDFVEKSIVRKSTEKREVGIIGTADVQGERYVKVNARRNWVKIWLLNLELEEIRGPREIVLHFKSDK
jgi:hypothetical protein